MTHNKVDGNVTGPLIQARDICGSVIVNPASVLSERLATVADRLARDISALWSAEQERRQIHGFLWQQAAWYLNVPMVVVLFEKIATSSTLRPLGVEEVMDWTEDVLVRVDRDRSFALREGEMLQP
jgi:hypothetical protein